MASEKLLRHIVLLKFKDEANQEQVGEMGKAFLALLTQIEAIHDLEWGRAMNQPSPYTHCLLVTCLTEADLKAYDGHPAHQAIPAKYGHLVEAVLVFDYWTKA